MGLTQHTFISKHKIKMKSVIALVGATAVSAMSLDADVSLFQTWKAKHSKAYETEELEMVKFQTFKNNAAYINEHNMKGVSFTLALNRFADMTNDEYKSMLLGSGPNPDRNGSAYLEPTNVAIPDSQDWRPQGYVTPIKDQGQCGSCWAFSTVAGLEGQHFKSTGNLESYSEQQLVDCSSSFGNQGCNGGLMDSGFQYIMTLPNGLDTEASYGYKAKDGRCRAASGQTTTPGGVVSGFVDIKEGNESQLTSAAATVGPISVAIDASHMSFQFYSSGVYYESSCSSSQLDHGVTVVGYGSENSSDYYIVKNSWGASWGLDGYINMARNKNNNCGIASSASYPLV